MSKPDSLFEQLYAADAEKKLEANKELVERRLRRAYSSAVDNLEVQVLEGEGRLKALFCNFASPDFSGIVAETNALNKAQNGITILKDAFQKVFGEAM